MKFLEEAVRELKGEEIEDDARVTVNLRVDFTIDEAYIPEMNQRLMVYRTVAAARSEKELETSLAEIRDRYGALPDSVLNLAEYGRIRVLADRLGVDTIDREGRLVVIKFRPQAKVDPARLIRAVHERPGATLVPPASLRLDLEAPQGGSRPSSAGRGFTLPPRQAGAEAGPPPRTPPRWVAKGPRPFSGRNAETSWWTARATAGAVTTGFSKAEMLRKPEADPRAESGMFARLEELLRTLG